MTKIQVWKKMILGEKNKKNKKNVLPPVVTSTFLYFKLFWGILQTQE